MLKYAYLIGLFLIISSIQNYFPHSANMNPTILLEVIVIILFVGSVAFKKIKFRSGGYQMIAMFLFFGLYLIFAMLERGMNPGRIFQTSFVIILFYFLTVVLVSNFNIGNYIFRAVVLAGCSLAVGTVIEAAGIKHLLSSVHLARIASPVMSNSNTLAFWLVMIIPCSVYLIIFEKNRLWRVIAIGSLPIFFVALVLGRSRMGFIALLTCVLMLSYSYKARKGIVFLLTVIVCFLIIMPGANVGRLYLGRIGTIKTDQSFGERRILFKTGLEMIKESPFLGKGYGSFRNELFSRTGIPWASHNAYIQIASEIGLIMLLLWLSIFGKTIYDIRLLRQGLGDDVKNKFIRSVEISIYVFLLCCISTHMHFQFLIYIYIGLVPAMRRIVAKERTSTVIPEKSGKEKAGLGYLRLGELQNVRT